MEYPISLYCDREVTVLKNLDLCRGEQDYRREAFPVLFRYMNSFWWFHLHEIELIRGDESKVEKLLDWLEYQMTRDDIRLP